MPRAVVSGSPVPSPAGVPARQVVRSKLAIGVIIPAFNEEANIGHLLDFLQDYAESSRHGPLELDVWVDVSGSTDGTAEIVRRHAYRWGSIHVMDTGRREGLLRALDNLLVMARGDFILRLDADLHLTAETLDSLVTTLTLTGAGIVGPRVVPGPSPSRWVTRLSRAEFAVHHEVCHLAPKTTLVQLFRAAPIRLRSDSGVEDVELQEQATRLRGPAAYDPDAIVTVVPPANLRDFLSQRVRTIRHVKEHARRGYGVPSTDAWRIVGAALLATLRGGEASPFDLALFFAAEALARAAARFGARSARSDLFGWAPLPDTKRSLWEGVAPPGGLTQAGEDPLPPLLQR